MNNPRSLKRTRAEPADGTTRRRRQPQTSCDFCRLKKLKCDRSQPCSNCVARGVTCQGQDTPVPSARNLLSPGPEILDRLTKLEQAVFGASQHPSIGAGADSGDDGSVAASSSPSPSSPSVTIVERQYGQEIGYSYSGISSSELCNKLVFRVANRLFGLPSQVAKAPPLTIWLPTRIHALSLLRDYADNWTDLLRVVFEPHARVIFDEVYDDLAAGKTIPYGKAGLVLSICATCAFFWTESQRSFFRFESAAQAKQATNLWRKAAWDVLDQSPRTGEATLEDIQALMVLADLIYNTEGLSFRFRHLQNCAVSAARDNSLHLVDSPLRAGHGDPTTREIKRRIWWHLSGTDWFFSVAGEPLERTYTINPRHMLVRYPRNMSDADLAHCDDSTIPPDAPTSMSFYMTRIRLAETCRAVADTFPPGTASIADLSFDEIQFVDRLFDDALADFPPYMALDAPLPPSAPTQLPLQRSAIHLGFHARRARLLRAFLDPATIQAKPHHARFRNSCLKSALAVLRIASALIRESMVRRTEQGIVRPPKEKDDLPESLAAHRSGTIVNHLFMACAVLATDPALSTGATNGDAEVEERREALIDACALLEKAGEENPLAASVVKRLVSVLRKHSVHGVSVGGEAALDEVAAGLQAPTTQPVQVPTALSHLAGTEGIDNDIRITEGESPVGDDELDLQDIFQNNGLWNDFMGAMPAGDGWGTLFADLDSFCGPV